MIVTKLTLKNFRNHEYLTLDFSKGLNLITGPNASGKTNIVEAIYYLSLVRSFRGVDDEELIKKNSDFASEIIADVAEGNIIKKIRIVISKTGRRIFVNSKAITKISDLSKNVNAVLFEPKDVMLFKGSPKERRNFIDVNLSKKSSPYLSYISKYEKVLKERNEILKSPKFDKTLLDANTEMLIKLSGPIISYRETYIKDINNILNKITFALTGEKGKIEIQYKPFIPYNASFQKNALEAFERALENDLKHKATSIGVHREDFAVSLNGRDIVTYGSQGENRLVALSLKISPYFLIEDRDKRPIVVLDDVMSELDKAHQTRLIKFLSKFEQVFITGTKLDIDGVCHYQLKKTKEVF